MSELMPVKHNAAFVQVPRAAAQQFAKLLAEAVVDTVEVVRPSIENLAIAKQMVRERRQRETMFTDVTFGEPAWDMLLDLYVARHEQRHVSVSSLCIASAVPATTALRWISRMTRDGLLVRHSDPDDRRRGFIELSDKPLAELERYFAALRHQAAHAQPRSA